MRAIRIGNDIRIKWPVKTGGSTAGLEKFDLHVEVRPSRKIVDYHNYTDAPTLYREEKTLMTNMGVRRIHDIGDGKEHHAPRRHRHDNHYIMPIPLQFRIEKEEIIAVWRADQQFAVGEYDILLYAKKDKIGQAVCDQCRFVRLVPHSAMADCPCDCDVESVIELQPVTLEMSGLSAYDIAVLYGFEGSEEEWIASLTPDDVTKMEAVPGTDKVDINVFTNKGGDEPLTTATINAATEEKAGVMTADDKKLLGTLSEKAEAPALIATIDLKEIDMSTRSLMSAVRTEAPLYYVVTTEESDMKMPVGTMQMFSDNMHHVVTQVFTTHLILSSDGTFDGGHRDSAVYTYYRSYKFGGTLEIPTMTWSGWEHLYKQDGEAPFMGVATPDTIPVKTGYNMGACYIASTAGTYAHFGDITLEAGEVALLIHKGNGGYLFTKQTVISTATSEVAGLMGAEDKEKLDGITNITEGEIDTACTDET